MTLPPTTFLIVRKETTEDIPAIRAVNLSAFPTPAEAGLVDALRQDGAVILSMVAEMDGRIIGHILYSPMMVVEEKGQEHPSISLAPMAVMPEFQNSGVGSRLVRASLEELKETGHPSVIVLGHPEYYPRFGFTPARRWNIRFPAEVPDEAFMALELHPGGLQGIHGIVRYHPAFDGV